MRLGQQAGQLGVVDVEDRGALQPRQGTDVEAERFGPDRPPVAQLGLGDVLVLDRAGVQGRGLGALGRHRAVTLHGGNDLPAAVGELPAQRRRDAGDVGVALGHLLEQQPGRVGQLVTQDGLVDEAGGAAVVVEVPVVEGGPPTVGPLGHVGDQDVGVQRRVRGPAGAVAKGGADEAVGFSLLDTAVATPDPAGVAFEVLDGLVDGAVVTGDDRGGGGPVAEAPHQRDRLRGRQREVHAGPGGVRLPQRLVGTGPPAGEDGAQVVGANLALEAEPVGAPAEPPAGDLADVEVVVLGAGEDLFEVVGLLAEAQAADAQHGRRPGRATARGTPVQVCGPLFGRATPSSPPGCQCRRRRPRRTGGRSASALRCGGRRRGYGPGAPAGGGCGRSC